MNPKICIAFNSGAAGDFFTSLVANQLDNTITPTIDNNGMVLNPPGESFKKACERFFLDEFKINHFSKNDISSTVVNTHHCYQEIVDLFPKCTFYYIDDSEHIPLTVEIYIKKRLIPVGETLSEWLQRTNPFPDIGKIRNLTDDQIRKVMINDWNKCLRGWKHLGLIPIPLSDILDKERCRDLVGSIVQSNINEHKFNHVYNQWAGKNLELITGIKYKL